MKILMASWLFLQLNHSPGTRFYWQAGDPLNEYFNGKLANLTVEMLEDTASAPMHNFHAERALGMMDEHLMPDLASLMGKLKQPRTGCLSGLISLMSLSNPVW
jgi:hypothetical protein